MHFLLTTFAVVGLGLSSLQAVGQEGNPNIVSGKTISLARDGNGHAQRRIVCHAEYAEDATSRYEAIQMLHQVGGWFAIRTFSTFLSNTPENTRISAASGRASDVRYLGRRYYAMKALRDLIPDVPFQPKDNELVMKEQYWADKWTGWIKAHESKLSRVDPHGPVDFPSLKQCTEEFGKTGNYK